MRRKRQNPSNYVFFCFNSAIRVSISGACKKIFEENLRIKLKIKLNFEEIGGVGCHDLKTIVTKIIRKNHFRKKTSKLFFCKS